MACQVMDAIYPGKVALGRVNFDAKTQPEYVANFKVLQSVFDAQQISKYIDVTKLLNGKFQDNLEFLQWLKQFFDKNYGGQEYNAKERREQARAAYKKGHKFAGKICTRTTIHCSS
jgi:RP/EB family microtubule-associated protein